MCAFLHLRKLETVSFPWIPDGSAQGSFAVRSAKPYSQSKTEVFFCVNGRTLLLRQTPSFAAVAMGEESLGGLQEAYRLPISGPGCLLNTVGSLLLFQLDSFLPCFGAMS